MNTQELILALATLLTPFLASLIAWKLRGITSEIRYLRKELSDCIGNSGNSVNSQIGVKQDDNRRNN